MELQNLANLSRTCSALSMVLEQNLLETPQEIQKLTRENHILRFWLSHLAAAMVHINEAFCEENDDEESWSQDDHLWPLSVAKDMSFGMHLRFGLRRLAGVVSPLNEEERDEIMEGDLAEEPVGLKLLSQEERDRIIEYILQNPAGVPKSP